MSKRSDYYRAQDERHHRRDKLWQQANRILYDLGSRTMAPEERASKERELDEIQAQAEAMDAAQGATC